MGAAEVVEILPLLQLVVEESRVVDHDTVQKAVELFSVDSIRWLLSTLPLSLGVAGLM
jgi:hypothetical protein